MEEMKWLGKTPVRQTMPSSYFYLSIYISTKVFCKGPDSEYFFTLAKSPYIVSFTNHELHLCSREVVIKKYVNRDFLVVQ